MAGILVKTETLLSVFWHECPSSILRDAENQDGNGWTSMGYPVFAGYEAFQMGFIWKNYALDPCLCCDECLCVVSSSDWEESSVFSSLNVLYIESSSLPSLSSPNPSPPGGPPWPGTPRWWALSLLLVRDRVILIKKDPWVRNRCGMSITEIAIMNPLQDNPVIIDVMYLLLGRYFMGQCETVQMCRSMSGRGGSSHSTGIVGQGMVGLDAAHGEKDWHDSTPVL